MRARKEGKKKSRDLLKPLKFEILGRRQGGDAEMGMGTPIWVSEVRLGDVAIPTKAPPALTVCQALLCALHVQELISSSHSDDHPCFPDEDTEVQTDRLSTLVLVTQLASDSTKI